MWAMMLPLATGIAVLAPILMLVICVALAIGPERVIAWIRDDWAGRDAASAATIGWIEEDGGRPQGRSAAD